MWPVVRVCSSGGLCLCRALGCSGMGSCAAGMLQVPAEHTQPLCLSRSWGSSVCWSSESPCLLSADCAVITPLLAPAVLLRCLELRNLFQLRNVFFCVALLPFANPCYLCLQVLPCQHFAAAGFLSRNWIALSDISIPT